jgi:hypothetical protein
MTGPEYPILALPGNEAYQLAHIATYIATAIARRRQVRGRSREAFINRWAATRDIAGAREALDRAVGGTGQLSAAELPQPLDAHAFQEARKLLTGGPRWAEVVSLSTVGQPGWAVLGHVPGIGPVGARLANQELAEAVRQHVLLQPASELAVWAVSERRARIPNLPDRVDLRAFVANLDPTSDNARAVAAALRGVNQDVDITIGRRFTGVDLDEPLVVRPPAPQPQPQPQAAPQTQPQAQAAAPAAGGDPDVSPWQTAALGGGAGMQPTAEPAQQPPSPRPRAAAQQTARGQAGTRRAARRPAAAQPAAQAQRSAPTTPERSAGP